MLTAISTDGTEAWAHDEGRGRVILILHPGMDDGTTWRKVASLLSRRFRVVIAHRRRYRLDLPAVRSIAAELDHIRALVRAIDEPILLVGHSSGAIVALEALANMPTAFTGAVLYDPPISTAALPLSTPSTKDRPGSVERARAAVAAGKMGRAFLIHTREVLRLPTVVGWLSALLASAIPRWRARVPAQVEDLAAIVELGDRLEVYAGIETPTIALSGERGQGDLHERLRALVDAVPHAESVLIPKQAHSAHRKAPAEVARVIETLANKAL